MMRLVPTLVGPSPCPPRPSSRMRAPDSPYQRPPCDGLFDLHLPSRALWPLCVCRFRVCCRGSPGFFGCACSACARHARHSAHTHSLSDCLWATVVLRFDTTQPTKLFSLLCSEFCVLIADGSLRE
eukprot:4010969-Prymnesium_polylepis.1